MTERPCLRCGISQCMVRRHVEGTVDGDLLASFDSIKLDRGQVLTLSDKAKAGLTIVVEGLIMVENVLADGRRQVAGFRVPGDLLCLPHDLELPGYELAAVQPSEVCRVRSRSNPESRALHQRLLPLLFLKACAQLAWSERHLLLLARLTAQEKVATFLLEMAARIGRPAGNKIELTLPMNREIIGDYLGLHPETVSRQFTSLKRRRRIELPKPGLVRLDPERLSGITPISWSETEGLRRTSNAAQVELEDSGRSVQAVSVP